MSENCVQPREYNGKRWGECKKVVVINPVLNAFRAGILFVFKRFFVSMNTCCCLLTIGRIIDCDGHAIHVEIRMIVGLL